MEYSLISGQSPYGGTIQHPPGPYPGGPGAGQINQYIPTGSGPINQYVPRPVTPPSPPGPAYHNQNYGGPSNYYPGPGAPAGHVQVIDNYYIVVSALLASNDLYSLKSISITSALSTFCAL